MRATGNAMAVIAVANKTCVSISIERQSQKRQERARGQLAMIAVTKKTSVSLNKIERQR